MDLNAAFRALVRRIVGLSDVEGAPPVIDRLAHYRARVDACAVDGATLDVTPEDKRISPEKNVPLRLGIPSMTIVVQPGAIVWLGFDGGDPRKPHCLPCWETAMVTKVIITDMAGGSIEISNGIIKLNNGTKPVSRVGDHTAGHVHVESGNAGPYPIVGSTIIAVDQMAEGNTTVLA
jgi:hypothetical protein